VSRTQRALFTGFLSLVTMLLLVRTLALSPGSRLAPLWVVIPTLALLLVQLALDLVPRITLRVPALQADSLFGASAHLDAWRRTRSGETRPEVRRRRALRIALWIGGLVVLVRVAGFLPAVPLFLAPYLHVEAGMGWPRSVGVAALTTAVIYLIFGPLLGVSFPEGLIG
jgi:hypothetical protein